jgi:hypothetical protein
MIVMVAVVVESATVVVIPSWSLAFIVAVCILHICVIAVVI